VIRIARPAAVPARLATHGIPDMMTICATFDAQAALYTTGPQTLPFKSNIYGHTSVKRVLQHAQHDKCCYCEGIFHGHAAGDVEHFRPKAYWQQDTNSPKTYPGYYWLAYEWSNLLFACQICNRSYKRNLFPISNQSRRARKRGDPVSRERPLLLDPSGADDPRDHIQFHQEVPRGRTSRGRTTIEALKLDRVALNDVRREKFAQLQSLRALLTLLDADPRPESVAIVTGARASLQEATRPTATFSGMARDFLNPRPFV
jgi:uncharacterized protein (TIGR02646 family)